MKGIEPNNNKNNKSFPCVASLSSIYLSIYLPFLVACVLYLSIVRRYQVIFLPFSTRTLVGVLVRPSNELQVTYSGLSTNEQAYPLYDVPISIATMILTSVSDMAFLFQTLYLVLNSPICFGCRVQRFLSQIFVQQPANTLILLLTHP